MLRRHHATVIAGLLLATAAGAAQIDWYSIDGGGAFSSGGGFELNSAIGQPDAGLLSGGSFRLTGGFLAGAPAAPACVGDIDGNGAVDLVDLSTMLAAFGSCDGESAYDPDADLDQSGCVDLTDLATLLAAFGAAC